MIPGERARECCLRYVHVLFSSCKVQNENIASVAAFDWPARVSCGMVVFRSQGADMLSFIAELRRRNVLRIAALYAATGWLIIQVVTQTFPFFGISQLV